MLVVIYRWRRRALRAAAAGLLAVSTAMAAGADKEAGHLVEMVMSGILHELESKLETIRDDSGRVDEIVKRLVLPHFDFKRMSRRVLGKRWKSASPDQRTRFIAAFRTTLVHTYGAVLLEYDGQAITYLDPVPRKKEGEIAVPVEIEGAGGRTIRVDYAMHHGETGWKVFDVAVDGVSLVTNYRSSFRSKIARDGIDGLISNLEDRNTGRGS